MSGSSFLLFFLFINASLLGSLHLRQFSLLSTLGVLQVGTGGEDDHEDGGNDQYAENGMIPEGVAGGKLGDAAQVGLKVGPKMKPRIMGTVGTLDLISK